MAHKTVTLPTLISKTVVVHSLTYMVAGIAAYNLGNYEQTFSEPPLSFFMLPTSDPMVMAGPLFQPLRGLIFALVLYPLREILFGTKRGWLTLWGLLVGIGILSTFGPSPGSIEGMIYTVLPVISQILGLWETLLQALLLSALLFYWVNHPEKRWLGRTLWTLFGICMILPLLGLLVAPQA